MEQRWVARLASYNFQVKHRSGKSNGNADALSRYPVGAAMTQEEEDGVEIPGFQEVTVEVVQACLAGACDAASMPAQGNPPSAKGSWIGQSWSTARWAELQQQDSVISRVLFFFQTKRPLKAAERQRENPQVLRLMREMPRLQLREGVLYRQTQDPNTRMWRSQLVLPQNQQKEAFTSGHDNMGHFAAEKTLLLLLLGPHVGRYSEVVLRMSTVHP